MLDDGHVDQGARVIHVLWFRIGVSGNDTKGILGGNGFYNFPEHVELCRLEGALGEGLVAEFGSVGIVLANMGNALFLVVAPLLIRAGVPFGRLLWFAVLTEPTDIADIGGAVLPRMVAGYIGLATMPTAEEFGVSDGSISW